MHAWTKKENTKTEDQTPEQRGARANGTGEANDNKAPGVIVGVGASAGGLAALEGLFALATPGAGLSFVVIQHLSPKQPSILADILRPHTGLRMVSAEAGMLEAGRIPLTWAVRGRGRAAALVRGA